MKKVVAVKANEDFSLELTFNDNTLGGSMPGLIWILEFSGSSKISAILNK